MIFSLVHLDTDKKDIDNTGVGVQFCYWLTGFFMGFGFCFDATMICPDINVIVGVTQLSRHIDYFRMVAATTWIAQIVDVTFAGAAVRDPTVIMSQKYGSFASGLLNLKPFWDMASRLTISDKMFASCRFFQQVLLDVSHSIECMDLYSSSTHGKGVKACSFFFKI